jgi:hypothetical protein
VPRENVALLAFNRGIISPLALARTDIKRTALSAETMTNWVARVFGSMMLRPGTAYLGSTRSDAAANFIPFIFSTDDTALVEITDSNVRVWVSDSVITRGSVSSATSNGDFDTDLTGWTDADDSGGTSEWVTGGYMGLTGNGTAAAKRRQTVTVAAADQGDEHALRIVVERGPVTLKVGSSAGEDDYISETSLMTGTHSLTLTPTGDFHIEFSSTLKRQVLVTSCNVEAAGAMAITAPWAAADLGKIRFDQSGDVLFIACEGYQQRRIERRSSTSWSVVTYQPEDGPFRLGNSGPITITPSALSGNITLTASAALFKSTNVGSLYRLTSSGQTVTASITAENSFTNAIRVTGVDAQRVFSVTIDEDTSGGATAATFTLQRSLDSEDGPWTDVTSYTADTTTTYDDTLDNQIAWYRVGVKTGDYSSGTHTATLTYTVGSVDGVVRITAFTSSIQVSAEVFVELGGTSATDDWAESEWSDRRGWPSSVAFVEGRLGWAGKNGVWLSASDAFSSFDDTIEGDSGPIARTVGSGPVDTINWMLALQRLILGSEGAELSCKSTSFDEPLTPTNFNIKPASTQGSAAVEAVKIDKRGVYVQRGGTRVMQIAFDAEDYEYGSTDLTALCPEVGEPSISRMDVQRQPDTRIHCVRSDGTAAIAIFDPLENVLCWQEFETDGTVEDCVILPGAAGSSEDQVYYVVKRTINGSTKRYLEKWAKESECIGGTSNKQADSFVTYSQSASSTISGLSHLEGEDVVVWDNGKCLRDSDGDIATFTVASGAITVTNAGSSYSATVGVVGLPYTAQWKSAKLAYAAGLGTALTQRKKLNHLGAILRYTHHRGLKYGPDFTNLSGLPEMSAGKATTEDTVHTSFDQEPFEFEGTWDADSRLCLQASAPRPCAILAAVVPVETHDKY